MRSAKNSPEVPAKANDFRSSFSEEIFLREVREKVPSFAHFKASIKDA
jgi:hypothetical protein